jgi:hypothetical protein
MAKKLLYYVERSGSLRLIVENESACDYDEFVKGLKWLASQDKPCRGCRFGGGWSWWPDCPVRDCVLEKGLDLCCECPSFPCDMLKSNPGVMKFHCIENLEEIKEKGIEHWIDKQLTAYYKAP